MVLGKLPLSGQPTIYIIIGHGPTALAVGAAFFLLSSSLSILFLPLFGRRPDMD